MKYLYLTVGALAIGLAAYTMGVQGWAAGKAPTSQAAVTAEATTEATAVVEMIEVTLPELAGDALIGQRVFASRCAACHGPNAGGIDGAGPPLIHDYYKPGHHGDMAFYMAAERGVQQHHWSFGNMLPIDGITRAEVAAAVAFVRAVQKRNNIF